MLAGNTEPISSAGVEEGETVLPLNLLFLSCIGEHPVRYPDQRYRTEPDIGTSDIGLKGTEFDIILDIGIILYMISDI